MQNHKQRPDAHGPKVNQPDRAPIPKGSSVSRMEGEKGTSGAGGKGINPKTTYEKS